MKSIIIVAVLLLVCVTFNEALQCYSHNACLRNCPQLDTTIKPCTGDDNRCYKLSLAGGVTRGCARQQCNIQVDAGTSVANVCCESDLCNSAITSKLTFSTFLMIMGVFILARM